MQMVESNPDSGFLKEFYIPAYILVPGTEVVSVPYVPQSPVLVFINSKSGGQLGGDLLLTYRSLLNEHQVHIRSYAEVCLLDKVMVSNFLNVIDFQVFDLGEEAPDKALRRIYVNLEKLKADEDEFAAKIEERLRIIVS